ncbi:FUSC family protein [Coxiella endosymbiont of Amblyomma nuttalli]|uniref:FUSC family protein n=1 Tax=Coxiella endosymbiont of Amblyomma nuttalli TaxID=2749996 RepID=UPI001BAC95AF|nr:FUSC family protein [Coxiella endosymbiont of Amblyomma nuttalli]
MKIPIYKCLQVGIHYLSRERLVASLKTALACLIGIFIGDLWHLSMPQWVLITILVVMATNIRIGGTIKKSYLRLLGTVVGALLAATALLLLGNHPTLIYVLLLILLTIFSYLASSSTDISQFGLLGATTMIMILDSRTPTLKTAGDRILEIFLGIVIAVLITRFVFPSHAKKLLRLSIASTLKQFHALYELFITKELTQESLAEQEKIENDMITHISKQNTLLQEALNEDTRVKKKCSIYQAIFLLERKLLRNIYMLRQTLLTESTQLHDFYKKKDLIELHRQISSLFDFINAICSKESASTMLPLKEQVNNVIEKVIHKFSHSMSIDHVINIHAFEFCLKHLVSVLYEIIKWLQRLNAKENLQH